MRLLLDLPALTDAIACGDDEWKVNIVMAFNRLEKVESRLEGGPGVLDEERSALHLAFHMTLIAARP
jgi:hypothetical protein